MIKFTVYLEHVTYAFIRESFPVYASNIDEAYAKAYRLCGNWYRVVEVK